MIGVDSGEDRQARTGLGPLGSDPDPIYFAAPDVIVERDDLDEAVFQRNAGGQLTGYLPGNRRPDTPGTKGALASRGVTRWRVFPSSHTRADTGLKAQLPSG